MVIRRGTWDIKAQVKEHVGNLQYVKEHGFLCGHGERNRLATCSSEGTCRIYTVCEGNRDCYVVMRRETCSSEGTCKTSAICEGTWVAMWS